MMQQKQVMVVASLDGKNVEKLLTNLWQTEYYFTKVQWWREKRHCVKNYGTSNCDGTSTQPH